MIFKIHVYVLKLFAVLNVTLVDCVYSVQAIWFDCSQRLKLCSILWFWAYLTNGIQETNRVPDIICL